jgi:hypothetical protein
MSDRSSGIIRISTLMESNIECELRTDMCLKLSGLSIRNNSLGNLSFNRFRLYSNEEAWSLQGLLNVCYPLNGWFTIYSSVVTFPVRDISSYLLSSYQELEAYCNHLFDVCKTEKYIGVIEVKPAIPLFNSNIFGEEV